MRLPQSQQQIVMLLRRHGTLTADALSQAMRISNVAVRRHLDALEAAGYVTGEVNRRSDPENGAPRRGRPSRHYRLTEAADDLFPQGYESLAELLLDYLASGSEPSHPEVIPGSTPSDRVAAFFREQCRRQASEILPPEPSPELETRVASLARHQERLGYMADWSEHPDGGFLLRQLNCPICRIARRYPQACDQELELVRLVTDADVARECFRGSGDAYCSYRIQPRHGSRHG